MPTAPTEPAPTEAPTEIAIRRASPVPGALLICAWLLLAAATQGARLGEGAKLAVLLLGPWFGVVALWPAVTWRVVIASREEIKVTHRPLALYDIVRIPRRELSFVALDQHDAAAPAHSRLGRLWQPRRGWSVVARTRSGATVPIARGLRDADDAKRLVYAICDAVGC